MTISKFHNDLVIPVDSYLNFQTCSRHSFPNGRALHSIKLARNQGWDQPTALALVRRHISFVNSLFARGVTRIIFLLPFAPSVVLSLPRALRRARIDICNSSFVCSVIEGSRDGDRLADIYASRRNDSTMSFEWSTGNEA